MKDPLFERDVLELDPEGKLERVLGLCKVGIASTDTAANVDLNSGGHWEMYETIYRLVLSSIEEIKEAEIRAREAQKTGSSGCNWEKGNHNPTTHPDPADDKGRV